MTISLCVCAAGAVAAGPTEQAYTVTSPLSPVESIAVGGNPIVKLSLQGERLERLQNRASIVLSDFVLAPMAAGAPPMQVTLELHPIDVFGPHTVFVDASRVAAGGGPVILAQPDVQMFGGTIQGVPDSHVFLSFSPQATNGMIRIGEKTQVISAGSPEIGEGTYIFDPDVLPRGVIHWADFACETVSEVGEQPLLMPLEKSTLPCREVLLAIETDFEFTGNLFGGNSNNSTAYVTTLIGAVSELYTNAINVRFRLGQVRVWTSNNDPWTASNTSGQLTQFRDHYNANMGGVPRNLAHFLSGRSLGGGIAYLSVVCNSSYGYGVSANLSGHFPYPIQSNNSQNWDLNVTAHEIGHNFGAIHTHDYCPPVDNCASQNYWGSCQVVTQCSNAGTIMSYCHTCSGGMSNIIMQFHASSINSMSTHVGGVSCPVSCGNTPPVVAISTPTNNASFVAGAAVNFSGSATDAQSGNLSGSLVWLSSLQGQFGSGASFSSSALGVGTHTITARCTDPGGLTGTATRTITIVPSPVNTPPSVAINSPSNGSSFTAGTSVSFAGSANDVQDGNLTSLIVWTSNIQGQIGTGGSFARSDLVQGSHTITARVTDSGSLQSTASVSITINATTSTPKDKRAQSDIPVAGTVTGQYTRTHSDNNGYQSIKEIKTPGSPTTRYSYLDHRWSITIPPRIGTRTFFVQAHQTASRDGDHFAFDYSTNGTTYTPMLTVTKTTDDGTYQTFLLPASITGKMYIRVRDTDRTPGNKSPDTVFIDDMFIRVQ